MLASVGLLATTAVAEDPQAGSKPVSVGFVRHAYGTWTAKIADNSFATATGRTLRWFAFDTDSAVAAAMAGGRVDVGLMGTSVAAAAIARGLDLKIFYVFGGSADGEGLVLPPDAVFRLGDAKSLQDKIIAVPFGSTLHFRLLQSLKRWSIPLNGLRIVNLQTQQISESWRRREIDAAVVSEPLLSELRATGRQVPMPSVGGQEGLLVFAGLADFVASHDVFLSRFIDVMATADSAFAALSGPIDDNHPTVRSIAFFAGVTPLDVMVALARYRSPPLDEQVSSKWLGGGPASALAAELRSDIEMWRWAGRLPQQDKEPDYQQAITPAPAERALAYRR